MKHSEIHTGDGGTRRRSTVVTNDSVAAVAAKTVGKKAVAAKGSYVRMCRNVFKDFSDADFYGSKATHIYFYNSVDEKSVQEFRKALYDANKPKVSNTNVRSKPKPIVVHIHSSGGDGILGITLANFLRECAVPVAVVVDGYACSAITPLLVSGAYRVVHDFSFVLFHEGSLSIQHYEKFGKAKFILNEVVEGLEKEYEKVYRGNTKIPKDMLDDLLQRDLFMDAATCMKYKVADRLIHISRERSSAMWREYVTKNPEFDVSSDPMRWSSSLNHLYNYNNAVAPMLIGDEVFQAVLSAVKPMQSIMQDVNGAAPKPVVLHTNMYMTPHQARWFDIAPLLIRVFLLPTPVVGVIDSDIDLLQALPCLLAHKRYMYSNTSMYITLQHYHQGRNVYYHDIKANTDMLRAGLKVLIKEYAPRFPADKLDRLFEDRMRLTAAECKAYGLVDDVIEPFMRDVDDEDAAHQDGGVRGRRRKTALSSVTAMKKRTHIQKKKRGGQNGGCACSQGLPIDYIDH